LLSKSPNASSATLLDTPRGWLFIYLLFCHFSYHFCQDQKLENTADSFHSYTQKDTKPP